MKQLSVKTIDGSEILVCLNCLIEVDENDDFCRGCGKQFDSSDALLSIEDIIEELKRLKKI